MTENELRTIFGKNIKAYRKRRKWSQADLAESANISINFLGDIERGKKWPHPNTLSKLADALEIKVFELFLEGDMLITPENKELMNHFIRDLSLTLNKSLSQSINQAIHYICKQYKLK